MKRAIHALGIFIFAIMGATAFAQSTRPVYRGVTAVGDHVFTANSALVWQMGYRLEGQRRLPCAFE